MKERHNLFIEQLVQAGDNSSVLSIPFDLRSLLPTHLVGKRFMLFSSFHSTESWGTVKYGSFLVQIQPAVFSAQFNKNAEQSSLITLGVAKPSVCANGEYVYGYSQNECNPVTVLYPENDSTVTINIESNATVAIDDPYWFMMCLSFEQIEE